MFLTAAAIREALDSHDIDISPFNPNHLGPNSYDVTLSPVLKVYQIAGVCPDKTILDMRQDNPVDEIIIPKEGLVLRPGVLYLGATVESAISRAYVPMFEGRSSVGRLGIHTHITAGFGDIGWGYTQEAHGVKCHHPTWTLEIAVVHPVRVYPLVRIGQVYFVKPMGKVSWYQGKYHGQQEPQPSGMHLDFKD